jgi:WhiB family transcriptional regulator, redox-sensing transcriptional regulator
VVEVHPPWSAEPTMSRSSSWRAVAACRTVGSSLFFAADGERDVERAVRERLAKAVCAACRVELRCRAYALDHHERHGIWGGLTETERARVWAAATAATTDPPPLGLGGRRIAPRAGMPRRVGRHPGPDAR